jgi:hypothetical protein
VNGREDDAVLELVLGKLDAVTKRGGYWMARCPHHEDREASLKIMRGTDQPVVLKCFAECETTDVLAAIGLTMADISEPREDRPSGEWTPFGPAIAVYDYTGEDGKLLFQVCRTADKKFPQRVPDPSKRSGWNWSLDDVRRVPYRLPRLLAAVRDGRTIYVPEGEKDVHAIEAAGGVATCNPGGAGKWRPEFDQYFRDADVVIIADKDEPDRRGRRPGAEHARDVDRRLRKVAKSVAVVEAAEGKDAADHLAAGHGLVDFRPVGESQAPSASGPSAAAVSRASFPVPDEAMFYGLPGEIVNSVDAYTEASRPAVLIHLLSGCGAMIGRGPHMVAGFAKHPPSIWALVAGGTSLGAKGTADATARTFLAKADPEFASGRVLPALSTGEGLIHQVRDDSDAADKDGCPLDEGIADKRLFVVLPEFRTVMAQARREANTLSATLRLAWDSPWILSVPNRNAPYKATGAHIVMVAHVTPGEFRARIDPAEIAGGLLNRYLIIASRSSKDLPDEPVYPEDSLRSYGGRLREAIGEARELGERRVGMTAAARELWVASYGDLKNPTGARSEEEEGILAAVVVRARPHVLRVALTYALLDDRQIVDRPHLAAALAVWQYSLDSARWLFRAVNPDLVRLQAFIDEAGPAGRTREQIANDLFAKHLKKDDLDRLLAQLGDSYEQVTVPTRGRPRTVFRTHPAEKAVKAGKATTSGGAAVGSALSPQPAEKAPPPLDQETPGQGVTPLTPLKPQGAAEDAEAADAAPEPVGARDGQGKGGAGGLATTYVYAPERAPIGVAATPKRRMTPIPADGKSAGHDSGDSVLRDATAKERNIESATAKAPPADHSEPGPDGGAEASSPGGECAAFGVAATPKE